MNDERQELLEKANELGLEFPSNVKTEKLKGMIAEVENPEQKPSEEDKKTSEEPKTEEEKVIGIKRNKSKQIEKLKKKKRSELTKREKIAIAKHDATRTRVVTITNRDNRENDFTTTVRLSFENQYFGLSRIVPLDIPVELEEALIKVAESTLIPMHKAEEINGKRTGNQVTVQVKKFAISYGKTVE